MFTSLEDVQKFGKQQFDAATSTAASFSKGLREIASESSDYSKKSLEASSAYVEKFLGAKTIDSAMKVQLDYTTSVYEGIVAQTTKLGELYANLAKEVMKSKPVEAALAAMPAAAEAATKSAEKMVEAPAALMAAVEAPVAKAPPRVAPTVAAMPMDGGASKAIQAAVAKTLAEAPAQPDAAL